MNIRIVKTQLPLAFLFLIFPEIALSQASDVVCDKCVHTPDISIGAVTSSRIKDGTIRNVDIAPNTITSTRIKDGSIREVDIAPNNISGTRILDGSISSDDIADGAITPNKLSTSVTTEAPILGSFSGLATVTQFNCLFPQNNTLRGFDAVVNLNRQTGNDIGGTISLTSPSRDITGPLTGTIFPFGRLRGTFDLETRDFGLLSFSSAGEFMVTVTNMGKMLNISAKGAALIGENCQFVASILVEM